MSLPSRLWGISIWKSPSPCRRSSKLTVLICMCVGVCVCVCRALVSPVVKGAENLPDPLGPRRPLLFVGKPALDAATNVHQLQLTAALYFCTTLSAWLSVTHGYTNVLSLPHVTLLCLCLLSVCRVLQPSPFLMLFLPNMSAKLN